jgi:hypothetical protein
MSEDQANYYDTKNSKPKYAQRPVSKEYKDLFRARLKDASQDGLEDVLNDIHDATLICRNDPSGLRASVEFLKGK